jgi:hypothetical protein
MFAAFGRSTGLLRLALPSQSLLRSTPLAPILTKTFTSVSTQPKQSVADSFSKSTRKLAGAPFEKSGALLFRQRFPLSSEVVLHEGSDDFF